MAEVSVRDLRNKGGRVLKRVARGETIIVTLDGEPIAELRPVRRRGLSAEVLIEHYRNLPDMDPAALRADLDRIIDMSL
jgi:prevent-host-death family protein